MAGWRYKTVLVNGKWRKSEFAHGSEPDSWYVVGSAVEGLDIDAVLDAYGETGWELVGVLSVGSYAVRAFFKAPA